jgi:hypothetical protein
MMHKNLFAYTSPAAMPEYVSINQRDGKITLDARGPAKDGQFGETVQIEIPRRELLKLFEALRDEVTPPMMRALGQSI